MKSLFALLLMSLSLYSQVKFDLNGDAKIYGKLNLSSPGNSLFIGLDAGKADDGDNRLNLFIGSNAGWINSIGMVNTFVGHSAGLNNSTGSANTFMGFVAGIYNETGGKNTFVGHSAGFSNETGSNASGIGWSANSVGVGYNNSTGLGYDADPDGSNIVRIGNSSITSIKAKFDITTDSDARFKTQINRNSVPGLEFIKKLSPVTYYYDSKKYEDWKFIRYGEKDTSIWDSKYDSDKILTSGFIAQEVESAAQSIGYDFSGIDKPSSDKATYGLRYSTFVVPLVKAVQEQQSQIENQENLIQEQKTLLLKEIERNNFLENKLNQQAIQLAQLEFLVNQLLTNQDTKREGNYREVILSQKPIIQQNVPNPFDGITRIDYFIPETYDEQALIILTGSDGKEIEKFKINNHGHGSISIDMSRLSNGTYHYSLLIKGKLIETKKMILFN